MSYQCVIKIDPATMTEVDRWTGDSGQVLDVSGSDDGLVRWPGYASHCEY